MENATTQLDEAYKREKNAQAAGKSAQNQARTVDR